MIQFSKLRLQGFKSFVDKTELEIGPGLTGIVGPNGCGKSNLVDALKWSMGENSSKRMRGGSGSMEDVIFNGTAKRPARNMAEVSVLLDNSARTGPDIYNAHDEIEVVRRIEKDRGSGFRINGKAARARDAQLLYADILSGSNSPYIVSQGKITNLIQAKPSERRKVLEDAAGISGLYARRHEAELRLRAADKNLLRLEDLLGGMEDRLTNLKKQARQANRYRNLSGQIRQLEVMIATLEWQRAHDKLNDIQSAFSTVESKVAERLTVVTQLTKTQTTQAQDLPDLRRTEAEMSAALQTKKLALQRLEDEAQRLSAELEESKAQLEQLSRDRIHEKESLTENSGTLERLEGEEKKLLANQDNEDQDLEKSEAARNVQQSDVDKLEEEFNRLVEDMAGDRARKNSLKNQLSHDQARYESMALRLSAAKEQLTAHTSQHKESVDTDGLRAAIEAMEEQERALRSKRESCETSIKEARELVETTRQAVQDKSSDLKSLLSEISTLDNVINSFSEEEFRPVFEDIQTDQGFELALSRALGDTLMASTDENAPIIWDKSALTIKDMPALPSGAKSLLPHTKAPDSLQLALSQIGVVADTEEGEKLVHSLKPGQSLVSRDGAYWRWDGLRAREEASDRHALQLQQKNHLKDLKKKEAPLEKDVSKAEEKHEKAQGTVTAKQTEFENLREEQRDLEQKLRNTRHELNEAIESQSSQKAEQAKLEESISFLTHDIAELKEKITEGEKSLTAFDDDKLEEQQQTIEKARESLTAARQKLHELMREYEISKQENSRRKARLHAISDERINLNNRCIRARERLKELDAREAQLSERVEELKKRPARIKLDSAGLLDKITTEEEDKSVISDKLAACEGELAETTRVLKEAEAELGEAREGRAHAQATTAERQRHLEEIREQITEKFGMPPEQLKTEAALDEDAMPDLEELKEQREKSVRSRDLIGPVNLRAEQEAEELEKELGGILNERVDLAEAIEELREGIQKLNNEARERLSAAFDHVNAHFRDTFARLFIGGKAHLALIESDDPLEAGLEIFAQPPGKALQSLSLLSGGEQTLTAMALIFAMFLTNPAPICVLDEVDAPLDDANVDRFCDLLDEFADRGETRFLIVTHHRLTMARMDRLYGVTMFEKGVSKLVSVDMNQQLDFLEAAE